MAERAQDVPGERDEHDDHGRGPDVIAKGRPIGEVGGDAARDAQDAEQREAAVAGLGEPGAQ